jgi:hypothetical protein
LSKETVVDLTFPHEIRCLHSLTRPFGALIGTWTRGFPKPGDSR